MDAIQGIDLVHDFFVEVWPAVERNYRADRGSLRGYAIRAFVHFARPRLIREARWVQSLTADPAPAMAAAGDGEESMDLHRVHAALNDMSAEDRTLLRRRFAQEQISERGLAREMGLSRSKLRERIAGALARLAVAVGETEMLAGRDLRVARALFAENRSIEGAAIELRMTETQVRAAQRRVLSALVRAASGANA
jgi:hypothetical protein